jgi:ketosteroid isomerase-like protein
MTIPRLASVALLGFTCALLGCSGMRHRSAEEPCHKCSAEEPCHKSAGTPTDPDRLLAERLAAGDIDGAVALYEPNAVLLREDGTSAVGHEAIRKEFAPLAAMKLTLDMGTYTVVTSDDLATVSHDFTGTGTDDKGKPVSIKGGAMEVVRRQHDGSWRFVIDDPFARSRQAAKPAAPRRSKRR